MGIVFGLLAAFSFSSTSVLVRVGQRTRPDDDGVFMSVLVNVVLLGVVAVFIDWPAWDTAAMVAFVIGGVIGTVGGRTSLLRAVRLIGPSRSNAFLTGAPVVAAIGGWAALGETLTALEMVGAALVISALLWLVNARSRGVQPGGAIPLMHYVIATGAPVFFGMAFVFRKWGLERFDSAVIGAFVGALSAYLVIILIDAGRGILPERSRSNFLNVSWWFVAAGVATSVALLSQFLAFTYLEAWAVGILQSTQGIWTIGLSLIFLKGDERIDRTLVITVLMVAAGVTLISLQ